MQIQENLKLKIDLFMTFAKIGLFTFGGGYAMIPMIENYCVNGKKWITHDEMMNITAAAESTPGPIAINCATYVGFRQAGFVGAVIATLGIVLPSFLLILLAADIIGLLLGIPAVSCAFNGMKIAVSLLIINASLGMIRKMYRNIQQLAIIVSSFALTVILNIPSVMIIIVSALAGIFLFRSKK